MKRLPKLLTILLLSACIPFIASAADSPSPSSTKENIKQGAMGTMDHSAMDSKGAAHVGSAMSSGTVKKIDKEKGRITLKHGPLKDLKMPAMTMAFKVKDPAMLDQVKPGDRVKFMAEKANGALTVTMIEAAK